MGHVYATDLLAGDIIYWKFGAQQNVGLLGIVIKNEFGDPGVLLSYGSGYGNCESNYSNNSRNSRRGPRVVSLLLKNLLDYGMFSFKFGPDGNPVPGYFDASYFIPMDFGVIRIRPAYFASTKSNKVHYGGSPYCNYFGEMQNIQLSMMDTHAPYLVTFPNPDLTCTFVETAPGCPFAPADPISYEYEQSDPFIFGANDVSGPYFPRGGQGPSCSFSGIITGGAIQGQLIFSQQNSPDPIWNWTMKVPITLTTR